MVSKNEKEEKKLLYFILILMFLVITLVVLIIIGNVRQKTEKGEDEIDIEINFTQVCYQVILEDDLTNEKEIAYTSCSERDEQMMISMMQLMYTTIGRHNHLL